MKLLSAIVFGCVLIGVQCHDWGWGACPRVDSEPNLSSDKFLGLWYVIEQFDTASSCYVYNYTRVSDTQLKVTKGRQFDVLLNAGFDHTNTYTGSLDIPSADDQGRMRVKWPANVLGKGDYIVFATDYTNYAGVYDCQPVTALGHRQSAAILSRTKVLDQIYVDKIKRRLMSFGIDDHDFDKIEHKNCVEPSESTVNVNIDDSTLRNIFNTAVDGATDLGTKIADGTRNLVNEGRRRLGYEDEPSNSRPESLVNPDAEVLL